VTEFGIDGAGFFQRVPRLNDSLLAEIFAREVPRFAREAGRIKPLRGVLQAPKPS
jgi:hypothetical protein